MMGKAIIFCHILRMDFIVDVKVVGTKLSKMEMIELYVGSWGCAHVVVASKLMDFRRL